MSDEIDWAPDGRGVMRAVRIRRRGPVATMAFPVACKGTGKVFDLGKVEVLGRYADCSTFKCPCCGVVRDDRPGGIGGIVRLDQEETR